MTLGFKKIYICITSTFASFDASCLDLQYKVKKVWSSWPQGQKKAKIFVFFFAISYFMNFFAHFLLILEHFDVEQWIRTVVTLIMTIKNIPKMILKFFL